MDEEAALVGEFATAGAGALAPDAAAPLTGRSATASAGTSVPAVSVAAAGASAATASGTVEPGFNRRLRGRLIDVYSESLVPEHPFPLMGQSLAGSAGTAVASRSSPHALTGQAATLTAGTLVPAPAVTLAGSSGTGSVGSVESERTRALTGRSVAGSAGTAVASPALSLAGESATGSAGDADPSSSSTVALSGQAATFATGAFALTGSEVTGSAGTLVPGAAPRLSGAASTVSAGSPAGAVTVALAGAATTLSAGVPVPTFGDTLTGAAATPATGELTHQRSRAVRGESVAVVPGTFSLSEPTIEYAVAGRAAATFACGCLATGLPGGFSVTGVTTLAPVFADADGAFTEDVRVAVTVYDETDVTGWTLSLSVTDSEGEAVVGGATSTAANVITILLVGLTLVPGVYQIRLRRTDAARRTDILLASLRVLADE